MCSTVSQVHVAQKMVTNHRCESCEGAGNGAAPSTVGKVGWSAALLKGHRVVAVRVLGSQQQKSTVLPAGSSRQQGPEARLCFLALAPSWP